MKVRHRAVLESCGRITRFCLRKKSVRRSSETVRRSLKEMRALIIDGDAFPELKEAIVQLNEVKSVGYNSGTDQKREA